MKTDRELLGLTAKAAVSECPAKPWVQYNPMTMTYDTADGTQVAAEVVENVQCLAEVLNIAAIRSEQRAAATIGKAMP